MSAGNSGQIEEGIWNGGAGENAKETHALNQRVDAQLRPIEKRQSRRRPFLFLEKGIAITRCLICLKNRIIFFFKKKKLYEMKLFNADQ